MLRAPSLSTTVNREWNERVESTAAATPELGELRVTLRALVAAITRQLPTLPDEARRFSYPTVESCVSMCIARHVMDWNIHGEMWE